MDDVAGDFRFVDVGGVLWSEYRDQYDHSALVGKPRGVCDFLDLCVISCRSFEWTALGSNGVKLVGGVVGCLERPSIAGPGIPDVSGTFEIARSRQL